MAQVFCTAGSDNEMDHWFQHGVAKERILSCRDPSFTENFLSATNGEGVDVVLNSLSGEMLHVSWKCVAEFGTMIDLGKRDLTSQEQLPKNVFDANRTFATVDISKIVQKKPSIIQA
jgi:NADPH:quinone reductase-like Zn-dependent oxidoreductase